MSPKKKKARKKQTTRAAKLTSRLVEMSHGTPESLVKAIKADHEDLKKFIEVLKDENSDFSEKQEAGDLFMSLLKSHASSEEKAVYTVCMDEEDLLDHALEGFVEHGVADALMRKLSAIEDEGKWKACAKVLAEVVEHHIDEEEKEFLPEVERHFANKKQMKMTHEFMNLRQRSQKSISSENAGVLARH